MQTTYGRGNVPCLFKNPGTGKSFNIKTDIKIPDIKIPGNEIPFIGEVFISVVGSQGEIKSVALSMKTPNPKIYYSAQRVVDKAWPTVGLFRTPVEGKTAAFEFNEIGEPVSFKLPEILPDVTFNITRYEMQTMPVGGGGGTRGRKANVTRSKSISPWAPTGRKIKLPDGRGVRSLYADPSRPGETRIRRMVVANRTSHATYATYVKPPTGSVAITTSRRQRA